MYLCQFVREKNNFQQWCLISIIINNILCFQLYPILFQDHENVQMGTIYMIVSVAISFKVIKEILFWGNECLICIIINETATSGNGKRIFLSPWILMVLKK